MEKFSNSIYSEHASLYAQAIENNVCNALFDRPSLLSLISGQEFERILDMGCGPGAYLPDLMSISKKITAIDVSDEFIRMVQNKYPSVKAYKHDLNQPLPEIDSGFDLVISPLTIHYIGDLQRLFSDVHRVLEKNGSFIFSTHHPLLDFENSISKNYFETEKLTQQWRVSENLNTEVSFYRRPMSDLFNALTSSGFIIEQVSEGIISEEIKKRSDKIFQKLSTQPQFIFIKAKKS